MVQKATETAAAHRATGPELNACSGIYKHRKAQKISSTLEAI